MKKYFSITRFLIATTLLFLTVLAKAQIDIDIDLKDDEWYEDPKIMVGVAIFLLILALIIRGRKS